MSGYCGNLLIGGMSLRDLQCYIEPEGGTKCKVWSGRLSVNSAQRGMLEIGRTYRLELNDGRSGQLVLTDIHAEPAEQAPDELVLCFEGTSALE